MFGGDDEEEDDGNITVVRYPCMPSLVALQQMRNRLNLARLGKKLMKWTAMATGRELRRLAFEIHKLYKCFREDMRNAFILLARGRYFYPNLNIMVTENISQKAMINVFRTATTITGVKVCQLIAKETGIKPYVHLGIEKGGKTICEAKLAWLDVIKRLVLMVQLRTSFKQVEVAHKTASNRKEVLDRIIIPRIRATIKYIFSELEELEREELYRVKKVQVNKLKIAKKKQEEFGQKTLVCSKTGENISLHEDQKSNLKREKPLDNEMKPPGDMCATLSFRPNDYASACMDIQLEFLKKQLDNAAILSEKLISTGFANIDVNDFLKSCEDVKLIIENFFTNTLPASVDEQLKIRLNNLKSNLKNIIETVEHKDEQLLPQNAQNFVKTCENVDTKLDICLKKIDDQSVRDDVKSHLKDLNSHIGHVVSRIEEYKQQELLTPSIEEFMVSCKEVNSEINKYINETGDKEKPILNIEEFVTGDRQDDMGTSSLDRFVTLGLNAKAKLEECKETNKSVTIDADLDKLMTHINDAIELRKDTGENGMMSDTAQDFIKVCDDIRMKIKDRTDRLELSDSLYDLQYNIDNIIKLVSKYKEQGQGTSSINNCIKSYQKAKAKMDVSDILKMVPSKSSLESKILCPTCRGACTCDADKASLDGSCERYLNLIEGEACTNVILPPPCNFCQGIMENNSEQLLCKSCTQKPLKEQSKYPVCGSLKQSQENISNKCQNNTKEKVKSCTFLDEKNIEPGTLKSTSGYIEKTVRKIKRIKRTLNLDGSVLEETETIVIKKEKYDPSNTGVVEDERECDSLSYESALDETCNDTKNVLLCITKSQNQRGFVTIKRAQSEIVDGPLRMVVPNLRNCISEHTVLRSSILSLETLSDLSPQSNDSTQLIPEDTPESNQNEK